MVPLTTPNSDQPILFFDGVCGLCNGVVDWLLPRTNIWKFAALQGTTAKALLPAPLTEELDTVVVSKNGQTFTQSDAVIEILKTLPHYAWIAYAAKAVPRPIRNLAYKGVAKIRYAVFGKREICRLPSPEERTRFLD